MTVRSVGRRVVQGQKGYNTYTRTHTYTHKSKCQKRYSIDGMQRRAGNKLEKKTKKNE